MAVAEIGTDDDARLAFSSRIKGSGRGDDGLDDG